MFRKLTCLVILLNIANLGFAQKNLKFGVAAGINYSTITINSDLIQNDTTNYKLGYLIKGIIEYQLNNKFSLRLEPGYEIKGSKFTSYGYDYTVNMNYLSLPILLRYSPIHQLSFIAGPKFSYRTSISRSPNNEDYFFTNKFDLGIVGGLMYNFNKNLSLGVTYYQGFMPLYLAKEIMYPIECGTDVPYYPTKDDYLHNNFGLQLSYVF